MASPDDDDFPVASAPIVMLTPPDTQDGPLDVFHTPPEESSLPFPDDQQRRTLTVDVEVCRINQAVDAEAGTHGFVDLGGFSDGSDFVDLGKDSDLGFSETQSMQENDDKMVAEGAKGDYSGDIPECQFDEPVKKLKLSDFPGDCFGVQENVLEGGEKMPVDVNDDVFREEIPMNKNLGSGEGFETLGVQLETTKSAVDVNKSSDEVIEASGMQDKSDEEQGKVRVLPSSIRSGSENVAKSESGKGREKKKCDVFGVLKALSENTHEEVEENLDGLSILEAAKRSGIIFPRPRWWPNNDKFNKNQRIV
ncbi:hypothetical protein SESBI_18387 [Sesbania bispinosa]|nr:hypothetical protein SESBI_18387 [Sesbania bispinosa]